jgi:putative ABC transport system permease protein
VAGIALGALAGAAAFRVLNSLLYGIKATDPLTLSGAALLLLVLAGAAAAVPAVRATRIAPAKSLRAD